MRTLRNGLTFTAFLAAGVAFANQYQGEVKLDDRSGGSFDQFGSAVAAAQGTLAIGATRAGQTGRGEVQIYGLDGITWLPVQTLAATDAIGLGNAIAIDGDTMIVGATATNANGSRSGAAYVYRKTQGQWVEEARLLASDGRTFQEFGISVDIDGDTAVVGAHRSGRGSAYVFRHDNGVWTETQILAASDAASTHSFGRSVGVDAGTIAVGALGGSGAVYMFREESGIWTEYQRLTNSLSSNFDEFGFALDIEGDALLVGAPNDGGARGGTGTIFRRDPTSGQWLQEALLQQDGPRSGDDAGYAVALEGDLAVLGAPQDALPSSFFAIGTALVFRRDAGGWDFDQIVSAADGRSRDRLGAAVALSDGLIFAGAADDDDRGTSSGSTYVFSTSAIVNHQPLAHAGFPTTTECDGNGEGTVTLNGVNSSDRDSTPGTNDDIVTFEWFLDFGTQAARSIALGETVNADVPLGDNAVTLEVTDSQGIQDTDEVGRVVVDTQAPVGGITSPAGGSCNGPADVPLQLQDDFSDTCDAALDRVYVLRDGKLLASDGADRDEFGYPVEIDGDWLAVSAWRRDGAAADEGAVYVFHRENGVWVETQKIVAPDPDERDFFGDDVEIEGDTLVIGCHGDDEAALDAGAAFVYRLQGEQWVLKQKLIASDADAGDTGGRKISLSGDVLMFGAQGEDDNGASAGAAYIFRWDGAAWVEEQKLLASDGQSFDFFGWAVAIEGDRAVVGAWWDDEQFELFRGSAYVFEHTSGGWVERQKLEPGFSNSFQYYGYAVDLDGDRLVVGAYGDANGRGAAYAYAFDGATWGDEQRIRANGVPPFANFGVDVDLSGDRLAVGSWYDDEAAPFAGAAYLFESRPEGWAQTLKVLAPEATFSDLSGLSVSWDGTRLLVGTAYDDDSGLNSGSAYVVQPFVQNGFDTQGDYEVEVTASDDVGNPVRGSTSFTIDLLAPTVQLSSTPDVLTLPGSYPFASLFGASDDDGASGSVVQERAYFDGCLLFDGDTFGNGDGLLSDELLVVDRETFCEAAARCGLDGFSVPEFRVEAVDCAGNVGSASRSLPIEPALDGQLCQADLNLAKTAETADLTWHPSFDAQSYDVVRGNLSDLRSVDGTIDLGIVGCVVNQAPQTNAADAETPAPGEAFFYVVRYRHGPTTSDYGWASDGRVERPSAGDCSP